MRNSAHENKTDTNPGMQIAAKRMPLKIFWLDMDKFLGDAAKIIDQLESFLLCVCVCGGGGGGGEGGRGGGGCKFGLSSRVRT